MRSRKNVFGVLVSCFWNIYGWHAYNKSYFLASNNLDCGPYAEATRPLRINDNINPYKLWPGLSDEQDFLRGETLYGFRETMEMIWAHQHPADCSKAKFMISNGWPAGIGAVTHVEGVALAIAIELGRVLLPHPDGPVRRGDRDMGSYVDNGWQVDTPYCMNQNMKTLDCYYEPWSSCTIDDALRGRSLEKVPDLWLRNEFEYDEIRSSGNISLPRRFKSKAVARQKTVVYINQIRSIGFVPAKLMPLLECSPMQRENYFYWWRAMSASYFLRPNPQTLNEITKYSAPYSMDHRSDSCIAMHVRRGDKDLEMFYVPLADYLSTAEHLWQQLQKPKQTFRKAPVLVISSEDPSVLEETVKWGRQKGWRIIHTDLFDRRNVSAKLSFNTYVENVINKTIVHHELEYISILVNFHLALQCDAWVCTLASNSCRLIDELRATVGNKANNDFADLSVETCNMPPCIGGDHIKNFGWRKRLL